MAFDAGATNQKASDTGSSLEFKSLSTHDLQMIVDSEIRDVSNVIGLEVRSHFPLRADRLVHAFAQPGITSILLRHFRWDIDKLIDRYMESSDAVLQSAGEPQTIGHNPNQGGGFGFVCGICYDQPPPKEIFSIRCNHRFCKSCWRMYAEEKIKTEAQCTFPCMREGCHAVIEDSSISALLDPTTVSR